MNVKSRSVVESAKEIRSIVAGRPGYVWPCTMKDIMMLFGANPRERLGKIKRQQMIDALENENVVCFGGTKLHQTDPVILCLAECAHASCLATCRLLGDSLDSHWDDFDEEPVCQEPHVNQIEPL